MSRNTIWDTNLIYIDLWERERERGKRYLSFWSKSDWLDFFYFLFFSLSWHRKEMSFMGGDFYRLAMVMLGLQFAYACVALFVRAALLEGMNPRVSVVYIQAMIALIVAPIAYFSRQSL